MRLNARQRWSIGKAVLAGAIIGGVGWQFARQLQSPELWERPLSPRPQWLAVSVGLYLLGLGFWASFWYALLCVLGHAPSMLAATRAYYVSQLGKYAPGKGWALLIRITLVGGAGKSAGVLALTAAYEVMTTMASGVLVAVVLLTLESLNSPLFWKALGLLVLMLVPIVPGVFNRIVVWMGLLVRAARRTGPEEEAVLLPRLRHVALAGGLALTACGWAMLGVSLWALIQAVVPEAPPWTWQTWARYTAFVALAYVAGFIVAPAPGGLGVRELILQQLLTPELAQSSSPEQAGAMAVVVALLLRLVWTIAEVVVAGTLYFLPISGQQSAVSSQESGSSDPHAGP